MAATIARAIGRSHNAEREATRLGQQSAEAQANTFKTFMTAKVNADGSGWVRIEREINGARKDIGFMSVGPETGEDIDKVDGFTRFTGIVERGQDASPGVEIETRRTEGLVTKDGAPADYEYPAAKFDMATNGGQF